MPKAEATVMTHMYDPVRHVVVDANVLSAFLHPGSTHNQKVRDRASTLLEAAMTARWPGLRLYTPAICIAESLAVLDKYRFCEWHGPVKQDKSKQLSAEVYEQARNTLTRAVEGRFIEELDHEPQHILMAGLISPVNCRYQIRRKRQIGRSGTRKVDSSRIKAPMGAADCLIVGLASHLAQRVGQGNVLLATGDQRLADVLTKARTLRPDKAEALGITKTAEKVGLAWNGDIYPHAINLQRATEFQMRVAFGGWPLPVVPLTVKCREQLTESERKTLAAAWLEVATENNISNPDSVAYGPALEDIRTRFAVATSCYLPSKDVFLFLLGERKTKRLPKPGTSQEFGDEAEPLPLFPKEVW